ncbi:hypothetical protein [Plebeiibacterium sediminum]|uniref:Uncharacterized protein n=1 Tax=Plebeiibacterium sediminum TaxID=2992112 RepID=A0AAE3SGB2_9BACT|nr:hypothetical protein [Plebeiobacterium sediminum]MCW3787907.1 hypothetical protein [Plebeiobacterium sediminum]
MHSGRLHKILKTVSKVAGITLSILGKDTISIDIIIVEKKKGKLVISKRISALSSYEEVKKHVPNHVPVIVNLTGIGALVKKVEFIKDGLPKGQIAVSSDHFITQVYNQGETGFVSIVRKDLIDSIEKEFDKIKMDIVGIRCNPFTISSILPILEIDREHVFSSWDILIEQNQIKNIKSRKIETIEQYTLGDEVIESTYILSFADCAAFFSGNYDSVSEANYLSEFIFKKLIVLTGWTVMILLLAALSCNFFINDMYRSEMDIVSGEYSKNKSILSKLNLAEKELNKKQDLIVRGGLNDENVLSGKIDDIISLMPLEIVLVKLEVNPIIKKIKPGSDILLDYNMIRVNGNSNETQYVYNWMKALKKVTWIKDVELTYYANKSMNDPADFILNIYLNVE